MSKLVVHPVLLPPSAAREALVARRDASNARITYGN